MRTTRAKAETKTLNDIVETLKRVPKARLEAVRVVVQALAVPEDVVGYAKTPPHKKVSLVDGPFCGMWKDRKDIVDGQTFARQLREMVEKRGDRRKNIR
jgi:hypothetical protein